MNVNPADVYLEQDARDLARIRYGMTLAEVCRRRHYRKRVWIAGVLCGRGWPVANVSRVLGYRHSGSLYHHMEGSLTCPRLN